MSSITYSSCRPALIPGGIATDWILESSWIVTLIIFIVFVIALLILDFRIHQLWEEHVHETQDCQPSDSGQDILQKFKNITNDTTIDIIWRKALIIALITAFVVELFILWRVPNLYEYLIGVLIVFVIVYLAMGWRNAHETRFQRSKLRKVIKGLEEKYMDAEPTSVKVV